MCRLMELMDDIRRLGALPQSMPQPVPEPVPTRMPTQRDHMVPAAAHTPNLGSDNHDGAPDDVYAQEEAAHLAEAPSTIGSSTPPPRTPSLSPRASPTAPAAPSHGFCTLAEGLVKASDTFLAWLRGAGGQGGLGEPQDKNIESV